MADDTIDELEKTLRAILISSPDNLTADDVAKSYRELMYTDIPFKNYGYNTLDALLCDFPAVALPIKVVRGRILYKGLSDDKTRAISEMVENQKGTRKTNFLAPPAKKTINKSVNKPDYSNNRIKNGYNPDYKNNTIKSDYNKYITNNRKSDYDNNTTKSVNAWDYKHNTIKSDYNSNNNYNNIYKYDYNNKQLNNNNYNKSNQPNPDYNKSDYSRSYPTRPDRGLDKNPALNNHNFKSESFSYNNIKYDEKNDNYHTSSAAAKNTASLKILSSHAQDSRFGSEGYCAGSEMTKNIENGSAHAKSYENTETNKSEHAQIMFSKENTRKTGDCELVAVNDQISVRKSSLIVGDKPNPTGFEETVISAPTATPRGKPPGLPHQKPTSRPSSKPPSRQISRPPSPQPHSKKRAKATDEDVQELKRRMLMIVNENRGGIHLSKFLATYQDMFNDVLDLEFFDVDSIPNLFFVHAYLFIELDYNRFPYDPIVRKKAMMRQPNPKRR